MLGLNINLVKSLRDRNRPRIHYETVGKHIDIKEFDVDIVSDKYSIIHINETIDQFYNIAALIFIIIYYYMEIEVFF